MRALLAGIMAGAFLGCAEQAAAQSYRLPPERHVIEVVRRAYGSEFIINGARFADKNACAIGWVAGQHVQLIAGDWHGRCSEAVFYNMSVRQKCALVCSGWFHWPWW